MITQTAVQLILYKLIMFQNVQIGQTNEARGKRYPWVTRHRETTLQKKSYNPLSAFLLAFDGKFAVVKLL